MSSGFHVRRVDWDGNRVIARLGPVKRRAVRRGTYQWFARSQEIVPLESGRLRSSGKVEMDGDTGKIVYPLAYAAIQHQARDFRHDPGRQAGYVSDATDPDTIRNILADELRRLFH